MELRVQRQKKGRRRWIVGLAVLLALVWGLNTYLFSRPAARALAADATTTGMTLTVHLHYYLDPGTLVVDLQRADVADPVDLFRGLLRAIKAVDDVTWIPGSVVLRRSGKPAFTIAGADLSQLAYQFSVVRNPASVLIKLVAALRLPGGGPLPPLPVVDAAGRWAGQP